MLNKKSVIVISLLILLLLIAGSFYIISNFSNEENNFGESSTLTGNVINFGEPLDPIVSAPVSFSSNS